MIDRRDFLNTLSASALLSAVPAVAASAEGPQPLGPSARTRIPLNGEWEHRIDGNPYDTATVPYSRHPSGFYSLQRRFVLPRVARGERAFVHWEAVTYWGRASVNGQPLGTTGSYVPYEFEFTAVAKLGIR